jgi:hypothetical protein
MAACSASSPGRPNRDLSTPDTAQVSRRLSLVIASNGVPRVAGGASSVLVGVYVADLARRGFDVGAALVRVLAAIAFGAELVGAEPLGLLADAVPTRVLMTVPQTHTARGSRPRVSQMSRSSPMTTP